MRKAVYYRYLNFSHILLGVIFFYVSSVVATEMTGSIGLEGRYYVDSASFPDQDDGGGSVTVESEILHKWYDSNDNLNVFTFIPFIRYDQVDDERTHGDIRQLDWIAESGNWEYQVGISKVFWGVAESAHLVDIINQTDLVESFDNEEKLGQPLVRLSYLHDDGALSVFVLPYFRERTFAGEKGRLRPQLPVDDKDISYESSKEENHIDYAFRLQHTFNEVDLGLSYFSGTSRSPDFVPDFNTMTLKQHYPLIKQTGLDWQYTGEDWLWKLEAIYRDAKAEDYNAEVGGFEYTIPRFAGTYIDLGLIAEYHYDSRGDVLSAPFQNDLFVGARVALNDLGEGEYLVGAYIDSGNQSQIYSLEYSSRIDARLKLNVEMLVFSNIDKNDAFYDFRNDSYLEIGLEYYF